MNKYGMNQAIGIVTAFDNKFYEDFKCFVNSLRLHTNIPLYAYPIDEQDNTQRPILEAIKSDTNKISKDAYVKIFLPPEKAQQFQQTDTKRWIQWHKADLIKHVAEKHSLKHVLWLDSDIIVLKDLSAIFDHIIDQPLFTNDYFAPLSCKNKDELYEEFPDAKVDESQQDVVLNSGVVGFELPRDMPILNSWSNKTQLIVKNPNLKQWITLYDQGTLIWTLRELKKLDLICDKPSFNHNAKRNAYEADYATIWPGDKLGGDLFDQITIDNPDVIIAHYAGQPKLSHLLKHNHNISIVHNRARYKSQKKTKIFGIGMERCGTHSLAAALRLSCRQNSWIRHEYSNLSKIAFDDMMGIKHDNADLLQAIQRIDRTDVQFAAEINHRWFPFVDQIINNGQFPDVYSFVLQLREPIDLITSRLYNCTVWDQYDPKCYLNKLPSFYQCDIYSKSGHDSKSNIKNNQYRIYNLLSDDVIDMHLGEIIITLDKTLESLGKLPKNRYVILHLSKTEEWSRQLQHIIPPQAIKWSKFDSLMSKKFGANQGLSQRSQDWVRQITEDNKFKIKTAYNNILDKHGIQPVPNIVI